MIFHALHTYSEDTLKRIIDDIEQKNKRRRVIGEYDALRLKTYKKELSKRSHKAKNRKLQFK